MSHTTEGIRMRFHHDGDFSGDIECFDKLTKRELSIPFVDFKMLVAEYLRRQRISSLEQETDDELLGVKQ